MSPPCSPRQPWRPSPALALLLCAGFSVLAGCSEPCCQFDGTPIATAQGDDGALWLRVSDQVNSPPGWVLLDTAAPVSLWNETAPMTPVRAQRRDVHVWDATATTRLRARFDGVTVLGTSLGDAPVAAGSQSVTGVLSGDFLRSFAVTIDGPARTVSFWHDLPISTGFLSARGHAVLRISPFGGGQLDAETEPDLLGQRGPFQFSATRLVVRACAAPEEHDAAAALPATCCPGDETRLATGVDLALVVGTGYGPLVLSETAWRRLRQARPQIADAGTSGMLTHPTLKSAVAARLGSIPRLAMVDREASPADDPGACAELGRARRIEQVAVLQAANGASAACVQPCDQDPQDRPRARHGSGYIEWGGDIPVAVIPDTSAILQSLRAEIRPEGPEIDGIAGAAVFARARLELDYRPRPMRAVLSCPAGAPPQSCRAVGRCPRLPKVGDTRLCFGLPEHGLPASCNNLSATCR